jgi:effector-binding domain-containing protein
MTLLAALAGALVCAAGPASAQPAKPASPPGQSQPPPIAPAQPPAAQPGDAFGEEVTLATKPFIVMKGNANWDTAFETLLDAFKSVQSYLDKQGLKPSGNWTVIYTQTDDTGFQYQAGISVAEPPKTPPRGDVAIAQMPEGKALKFTHRGSYDGMDLTYEAITSFLDEKRLEAKDLFIEEYLSDPVKTAQDKLIVNIYVPLK